MLLLASGIPLGMIAIVGGAVLLFTTSYKTAGKIVLGMGGILAMIFLILILLAFLLQL